MTRLHRPPSVPLVPFLWKTLLARGSHNEVLMRFFEKYGDIFWMRRPGASEYLVSNPAYVKHILADAATNNYPKNFLGGIRGIVFGEGLSTVEGAVWKRHRRMIQPAFQRDKVLSLAPRFVGAINRLLDKHWEPYARSGEPMDVYRETSRLALTMMNQMLTWEDPPQEVCDAAFPYMLYSIRVRSLVEEYVPLPQKVERHFARKKFPLVRPAALRLNDYSWEQVRGRMARSEQQDDMLGHLITATDERGERLSELEVRDEFIEFLYGGHVSASISLAWTWYCMSQHGEVREQLYDTVDRVLNGRLPTLADAPALQYVSQVYDEVLRLYSPAPGVGRPAIMDDKIGDYDVPKGTMVGASAYIMHRHPAYWKDPYTFNPANFEPEQVKARPRFVYIPFGGGQRVCIGAQVATLYALLVNTMVAQRYRLELVPGKRVRSVTGGAHYPDNLWMKVVPVKARRQAPAPEAPTSAVA